MLNRKIVERSQRAPSSKLQAAWNEACSILIEKQQRVYWNWIIYWIEWIKREKFIIIQTETY